MTTITAPVLLARPVARSPLRLALTPDGTRRRLDGAWWPHSRDLSVELPQLIEELDRRWGRISRASIYDTAWAQRSHSIATGSHDVRVNWYDPDQDPHAIALFSYRIKRWQLLVIPPETASWRAGQLMTAAARSRNQQSARALFAHGPLAPALGTGPYGHVRIRTRHDRTPATPAR
ncbi:DUF5994 family protein [Streptacidiphilus rugosus]|uniref:DUF5994 family protein n=1 Tax=Streptacidiphilus rugosus TaxID=405783 RepID=UPI00068AC71D|nr:DUF5994 family protein [Streptacidiphilus rugosus]